MRRVACESDGLGDTRPKWYLCAGCLSIALSFARVSSHVRPASSACPCSWLVAVSEQFSVSRFLRAGSQHAHSGVRTSFFQREVLDVVALQHSFVFWEEMMWFLGAC